MIRFRWHWVLRWVAGVALLLALSHAAGAQQFEEGDWTAWGDSRQVNVLQVGRDYIYVGTSAGVLRFHRYDKVWEDPWYSVPGTLNRAVILKDVVAVFEDPLTLDLYVRLGDGRWLMREVTSHLWLDREPDSVAKQRFQNSGTPLRPNPAWVPPWKYDIATDGTLSTGFLRWEYAAGIQDDFGNQILVWKGFGLGVSDSFHGQVALYPLGPSSALAMARDGGLVWCAGKIDRRGGLVWNFDPVQRRWTFFHPDEIYDLTPSQVSKLTIGTDGTVWLATDHGVMRFRNGDWRRFRKQDGLPTERVPDIAATSKGAWIATRFGVAEVEAKTSAVHRPDPELEPLPAGEDFSAVTAWNDVVYAGAAGLLLKRDPKAKLWTEIEGPSFVGSATPPLAMYADGEALAIGDRQGFAWRESNGWQEELSQRWRYGTVLAIERHAGYWWLGTDQGLVRLNPETRRVVLYTTEEGLPGSGEVYTVDGEGDYLWLGTDDALVRFHWKREGRTE